MFPSQKPRATGATRSAPRSRRSSPGRAFGRFARTPITVVHAPHPQEDPLTPAPAAAPQPELAAPMVLLAKGVPLSLLLDLALGPRSEDLLREEVDVPAPRQR